MKMSRRDVEASREVRLWITQVIIPAGVGVFIFVNTEFGKKTVAKAKKKIDDVKSKFAK